MYHLHRVLRINISDPKLAEAVLEDQQLWKWSAAREKSEKDFFWGGKLIQADRKWDLIQS